MVRKTFEELISGIHFHHGELVGFDYNQKEVILDFLEFVRWKSLEEAANNADAHVNIFKSSFYNLESGEDYEVYVLKESILQLPKDSIEI